MQKFIKIIIISIFLGCIVGPFFVVIAIILDVLGLRFPVILPVLIALLIVLFFNLIKIRKERKLVILISTIVLLLSAVFSMMLTAGFIAIGPKGEQIPMYYLMLNFKYDNTTVVSPPWKSIRWNFYEPPCYTVKYSSKLDDRSLVVACFYYDLASPDPLTLLKFLINNILCNMKSQEAYERYRDLLIESGFKMVNESAYSFTAVNETMIVYCQLDGKFIMVVKVNGNEKDLLSRVKITRGKFW